ncbi:hypothetical protein ACLKA7_004384 [Drosophila subpalustris]
MTTKATMSRMSARFRTNRTTTRLMPLTNNSDQQQKKKREAEAAVGAARLSVASTKEATGQRDKGRKGEVQQNRNVRQLQNGPNCPRRRVVPKAPTMIYDDDVPLERVSDRT